MPCTFIQPTNSTWRPIQVIIWKRTAAGDVVQTQLPSHAIVRLNGDPNLDGIASSKFSGDLLDVLLGRDIHWGSVLLFKSNPLFRFVKNQQVYYNYLPYPLQISKAPLASQHWYRWALQVHRPPTVRCKCCHRWYRGWEQGSSSCFRGTRPGRGAVTLPLGFTKHKSLWGGFKPPTWLQQARHPTRADGDQPNHQTNKQCEKCQRSFNWR